VFPAGLTRAQNDGSTGGCTRQTVEDPFDDPKAVKYVKTAGKHRCFWAYLIYSKLTIPGFMQYNTSMQESDAVLYYTPHPPKAQTPMNAQVTTTVYFC
jgi:hypothetical protein